MAISRSFFVAAALLVLLNSAREASANNHTITLTDESKCLDKTNKARGKANLTTLTPTRPQEADPGTKTNLAGIWKDVCDALLGTNPLKHEGRLESSDTYALFELSGFTQDQDNPTGLSDDQCSAAVEDWQKGFEEFEQDSPLIEQVVYQKATSKQVSFVTLYNPHKAPTGHCSVAACATSEAVRGDSKTKAVGLVCSTTPNAFSKDKLFGEEEWKNIKNALAPPKEDEQKVTITDGNSCLTKLNAAREEAGLSALTEDKKLFPEADETITSGVSKAVCDTLLNKCERRCCLVYCLDQRRDFKLSEDLTSLGTFAVFEFSEAATVEKQQTTPTDAQCSAAVEEWQQGFKPFEDDPPVDKGVQYSEASSKQVSFVTLYNPDSQAKGQCSLATCKASRATRDKEEKTVTGLVCSTSPKVFGKDSWFTKRQWDNIKNVLSNSASATVPSILALATVLAAAFLS